MPRCLLRLPLAVTLLGLGACTSGRDLAEHDYRQHFPVAVVSHTEVAVVSRPQAGQGFTAKDHTALEEIGREHMRHGAGPVVITVASRTDSAEGRSAAQAFAQAVAAETRLPAADVKLQMKVGNTQEPGTALVEAPVWISEVPECGRFDRQPTPDYNNGDSPNFGCSIQRNVGLMVQDPADLVRMRDSTGRDGNRSADVVTKYGKGSPTASGKEVPTFAISIMK